MVRNQRLEKKIEMLMETNKDNTNFKKKIEAITMEKFIHSPIKNLISTQVTQTNDKKN